MAREKKPRWAVQRRCKDEAEMQRFHQIAADRGLTFSDMLAVDYLQQQPKVTFATPERKKLIDAIDWLRQTVAYLNTINPQDEAQRQSIDFAIEGAVDCFNQIRTYLNDNKG